MKGEYLEETQDHHHSNPNNVFSKLQQEQTQTFHYTSHHQTQPTFHHHYHIATTAAVKTSAESDNRSHQSGSPTNNFSTAPNTNNKDSSRNTPSCHDLATIEIIRRPRGRPPGSRNKVKPPVIITREPESCMSPYVLELSANVDIVESVSRFCRKRNIGLCIFNGSGSVTNVTLRQPSSTPGATVTFHGRFDILSISATILLNNINDNTAGAGPSIFRISLAGPQGQVFGGAVVGPLISGGTIYLIAATFNNPDYQRLPVYDNVARNAAVSGGDGGGNEGESRHWPPAVSGGGNGDSGHPPPAGGSGGDHQMGMHSCNLSYDNVIWAPTARQPPPY